MRPSRGFICAFQLLFMPANLASRLAVCSWSLQPASPQELIGHLKTIGIPRVQLALDAGCDLVLLCNSPDRVPGVLESLGDYVNPTASLRLTRLHGRGGLDWENLHESVEWKKASDAVSALTKRPKLSLEG